MKLLYVGSFCEPSQEEIIQKRTKGHITLSGNTFQRAFLSGFYNLEEKIDYIFNIPDIGSFPLRCSTPFFEKKYFEYELMPGVNCAFFNLTFFKIFSIEKVLFSELQAYCEGTSEVIVIVVYSLKYPYLKAVCDVKKLYRNVKIVNVVLDLPEYFGSNKSFLYRLHTSIFTSKIYRLTEFVDSFVLLTPFMMDKLRVGNRPWMLLEGIYKPINEQWKLDKMRKTILYTGKLDSRYGINHLLEAFFKLPDTDFKLWICGIGEEEKTVRQAMQKDDRIKYFGQLSQEDVFKMQRQATLLVNPRRGDEEYTKYSFPSKTMEYMASGTPTIMYDLPGVPDEYKQYAVIVKDNSPEALSKVLKVWGSKDESELRSFGMKARDFIVKNKTAEIQVGRFLSFVKKSFK